MPFLQNAISRKYINQHNLFLPKQKTSPHFSSTATQLPAMQSGPRMHPSRRRTSSTQTNKQKPNLYTSRTGIFPDYAITTQQRQNYLFVPPSSTFRVHKTASRSPHKMTHTHTQSHNAGRQTKRRNILLFALMCVYVTVCVCVYLH